MILTIILRPHSRVTGNLVASSQSRNSQKWYLSSNLLIKLGARHEERATLTRNLCWL